MSIKKIWGKLRYWQRGGVIGGIVGVINWTLLREEELGFWNWLIVWPFLLVFGFFIDIFGLENIFELELGWLIIFVISLGSYGIAFGELYRSLTLKEKSLWSMARGLILLIVLLIAIIVSFIYLLSHSEF